MKIKINAKRFYDGLQSVGRVVSNRNVSPALGYFMLKLSKDELEVTGSDSEIFIQTTLPLDEPQDNCYIFYLSSWQLLNGLKELLDCQLTLDLLDSEFVIYYPQGKFSIPLHSEMRDYPSLPNLSEETEEIILSASVITHACSLLTQFVDMKAAELRPVLGGIHFNVHNNTGLDMVSTDGHVLSQFSHQLNEELADNGFIISSKTAGIIANLSKKGSDDICTIKFDSRNVQFDSNGYTITARLIDGKYPNYRGIWPPSTSCEMTVDRQGMISVLKRCLIFSNVYSRMAITIRKNELIMCGENMDFQCSSTENMPVNYDGPETTVYLNGNNLLNILKTINDDTVVIRFNDPTKPFILIPEKQEQETEMSFLLMPMA